MLNYFLAIKNCVELRKKCIFEKVKILISRARILIKSLIDVKSTILLAIVTPIFFAIVYKLNASSFSVSNPDRAPFKEEAIEYFFSNFCGDESFGSQIIATPQSCEVIYKDKGLFTDVPGTDLGYYTKNIRITFSRFESNMIYLRYKVEYDWAKQKDKLPIEMGEISIDLSNMSTRNDIAIYQLNPFFGIEDIPVEKISKQPPMFDEEKKKWTVSFPSVLSFFTFKIFKIKSNGSMTAGNKFPYFPIRDQTDSLISIKDYFNNGTIKDMDFGKALSFSYSTFISFGISDIYPRTSLLKLLCSLQTLLGLIIFGLFITSAYESLRQSSLD